MDELTGTVGIVALAACALALAALVVAAVSALRLRRVRADQRLVLGEHGEADVVAHAAGLERDFADLADQVRGMVDGLGQRMDTAEARLDATIAFRALVRYDAYGEMSGQQSASIALLDASRSGVVLTSIHHRDQARLYVKQVHEGEGELELSPEEADAVRLAVSDGAVAQSRQT